MTPPMPPEAGHGSGLAAVIAAAVRNRILVLLFGIAGMLGGIWALTGMPLDAIPDSGDLQVIVYSEFKGRSPRTVEDQVTYPLTTALVSVPGAAAVRGYSFFGYSLIYVLFEDGADGDLARTRVAERLGTAGDRVPEGVVPRLGPDGTGVGWIYEYALVSETHSLQALRSLQDWYLKYRLGAVPGVAEVASVGGFVKQYQVQVDPRRLQAMGVTLEEVERAIRNSNSETGAEVVETGEREMMVRGRGYLRGVEDLRRIPVRFTPGAGGPVTLADVAVVTIGPEMRRGVADLDGEGEVVAGIVVMRSGANAREVIRDVKRKLADLQIGLPAGVRIVPVYDRSELIDGAIRNLAWKLLAEMLAVALVCALFLWHVRSALVAAIILPAALLLAFLAMRLQGLSADIMSLGGIAIAIGAMVDGAIVLVENLHKHLEREGSAPPGERRDRWEIVIRAAGEVGPALFWSLLVITVSFLPILLLDGQAGRLFRPLAFTKTYCMAAAALFSLTLMPILLGYFVRGGIRPEESNPLNLWLRAAYRPLAAFALRRPRTVILAAALLVSITAWPFSRLGTEFMPRLHEGDLLYMPTTLPGISITKAKELLQQTDRILASFPEVERVFGKVGRAETATDPAGLDMIETIVRLKPRGEWRPGIDLDSLVSEMDRSLRIPGLTNAWTLPIKSRIDMQSTGIRTPLAVKVSGPDTDTLQAIALTVERALRRMTATRSALAERSASGSYLDVRIDRSRASGYGLNVSDIQAVLGTALGGMTVTTMVEGLERYPVSLRYSRELRDNLPALRRVPIPLPGGGEVRLEEVADIGPSEGPMVVRSEGGRPNTWVFIDPADSDLLGYIKLARAELAGSVSLPPGYDLSFSGQYEAMARTNARLGWAIPLTLLLIFILLHLNTRSMFRSGLVMAAVPFSLVGAVWALYLSGTHLSVAVWTGMVALAGLDAETGVVMLLYLDRAYEEARSEGRLSSKGGLEEAILRGSVQRLRPKVMTASVILAGLLPILFGQGPGSDVLKRIALPMVGGVVTSVILELAVYPAAYLLWRRRRPENKAEPR